MTVATFTDTDTAAPASDFVGTIDWGDGTTTAGTVTGSSGSFTVSGTHAYATSGQDTITVTLADDAPGTATAISTALIGLAPNKLSDFNGDGKGDILWQNVDGTPGVWLLDGTGVLSSGPPLPNPNAGFSPLSSSSARPEPWH